MLLSFAQAGFATRRFYPKNAGYKPATSLKNQILSGIRLKPESLKKPLQSVPKGLFLWGFGKFSKSDFDCSWTLDKRYVKYF